MINLNPTLTAAGLALFSGQSPGFNVAITHVAFGSSKYDPIGYETALNAELARFPIDGSALISPSSIQVGVLMTNAAPGGSTANGQWIGEIGFYAGNTLFAVLSHAAAYLFFKSPDIDIPVTYVLDFSVLPPGSITVNNDALSSSIALASSYAQAAAKTSLDTLKAIQSRFYGNYSFDPQTRPDGSPREAGDEYFNTTDNQRKTYTGNAWSAPTYSPDAVAITGGTISHVIQNGLYNCDPSKFAWWCSALAKARAGYQPARLLMPGDSTTSGVGSNPSSPSIDSRRRAYPARLAEVLTAQYGLQADASSIWCDGFEGMNIGKFDPRIKLGAGWSISNTFVAGGRAFLSNAKFNRLSFAPGIPTDTCDVYFVRFRGYAEFIMQTNGDNIFLGAGVTTGPDGIGKITVKKPLGMHRWDLDQSTDGTLLIVGFDAYNSVAHNVSVWNMGASGSRVADWATGNEGWDFRNAVKFLAPDLSIIGLTINDSAFVTDPNAYIDNMQHMIDACRVTGDVLLVAGVPSNVGTTPIDVQQRYRQYLFDRARANDLPLIDLSHRWISQSYRPDRGMYFDGVHPSDVGYVDVANIVAKVIGNP